MIAFALTSRARSLRADNLPRMSAMHRMRPWAVSSTLVWLFTWRGSGETRVLVVVDGCIFQEQQRRANKKNTFSAFSGAPHPLPVNARRWLLIVHHRQQTLSSPPLLTSPLYLPSPTSAFPPLLSTPLSWLARTFSPATLPHLSSSTPLSPASTLDRSPFSMPSRSLPRTMFTTMHNSSLLCPWNPFRVCISVCGTPYLLSLIASCSRRVLFLYTTAVYIVSLRAVANPIAYTSSHRLLPNPDKRSALSYFYDAVRSRVIDDIVTSAACSVKHQVKRFRNGFLMSQTAPSSDWQYKAITRYFVPSNAHTSTHMNKAFSILSIADSLFIYVRRCSITTPNTPYTHPYTFSRYSPLTSTTVGNANHPASLRHPRLLSH